MKRKMNSASIVMPKNSKSDRLLSRIASLTGQMLKSPNISRKAKTSITRALLKKPKMDKRNNKPHNNKPAKLKPKRKRLMFQMVKGPPKKRKRRKAKRIKSFKGPHYYQTINL